MNNEKEITHIDLFSGIGGFTLAAEWAGFKTVVFCEKEKFCQKVLKKHWSEIPIIPEIRDFNGTKYRGATLLTGGFPCQPFSGAGKRRGKEDDRYLWPEMLRVIDEAKPHWILAENVPGIFRMALDTVLSDLESKGYATGTFIIPACGLDAPHRRNRIWIVANSTNDGGQELYRNMEKAERQKSQTRHQSPKKSLNSNSHASDSEASRIRGIRNKGKEERPQAGDELLGGSDRLSWQEDWYEVAARFCGIFNGFSDWLDRYWGEINDKSKKFISRKDMQILWQQIQKEKIWQEIGRLYEIPEKGILQSVVCKLETESQKQDNILFEGKKIHQECLRRMQDWNWLGYPSYRRKHQEQQTRKHYDSLPLLSHEIALATESLFKLFQTQTSTTNRVGRLKALGNAIVPQIAYEILKNIAWIEKEP